MTIFGERLSQLLYDLNLSYREAAEILGTGSGTISSWVNKDSYPNTYGVIQIAEKFGVSTDWLLGLSDVKKVPDRDEVSDTMNKIYDIESPHLSTPAIVEKKYRFVELWGQLFGEDAELPKWM